jgi:bacterioferritin (cytochrome b1)
MLFGHKNDNACINEYMLHITMFNGRNRKEMARNEGGKFP